MRNITPCLTPKSTGCQAAPQVSSKSKNTPNNDPTFILNRITTAPFILVSYIKTARPTHRAQDGRNVFYGETDLSFSSFSECGTHARTQLLPSQEKVKGKRTVFKGKGRPHASSHPSGKFISFKLKNKNKNKNKKHSLSATPRL
ncbi:MAG: hypothetical protein GX256_05055 [Fretibacterium sp.]|nr:hypothetical protein [Fretibacterium sp.]